MDAMIGRRAHMLMWDLKISQASLAESAGIERVLLGRKLRGIRPWYAKELIAIAGELKTSVAYLCGEEDDPHPPGLLRLDSNQQHSGLPFLHVKGGLSSGFGVARRSRRAA